MIRDVLRYPDPRLKQRCRELGPGEGELVARVARDLVDTMRSFGRCVGIAAPQIGELVRMFAVDCSGHPEVDSPAGLLVLVNPAAAEAAAQSAVGREGCLSIPDLTGNVRRATEVVVAAQDVAGAPVRVASGGFEARALLHELDHLDGVLFLDRVRSAADVFARRSYA